MTREHLWRDVVASHAAGHPLPAHLVSDLAEVAQLVLAAESPRHVLQVLGLAGNRRRHNGLRQREAQQKRLVLADQVRAHLDRHGGTLAAAIEAVAASTGASVSAVKKAYWHEYVRPVREATSGEIGAANLLDCWR
jgi:hypothetical protein